MTLPNSIVFLVDVDDTLLENDHIEREFGPECRDRFWAIQEELFQELGYRDYLGALQRFRMEHPYERHLVTGAHLPGGLPVRQSPVFRRARRGEGQ